MQRVRRIERPYDKKDIFGILDQLELSQVGHEVLTRFNGELISDSSVTDKYELFDFPPFAKSVIEQLGNYFIPEKYQLRISKGQQEIRLIGEDVVINGEKYQKMFNILNSTDKSRALQLNIGLIRFICTNGMVIAVPGEYTGIKVKHFKATLPGKVSGFVEDLDRFNIYVDKQSETIEKLSGRFISFKELIQKIALDVQGEYKMSQDRKFRAFGKKVIFSETDRISVLNHEQISLLKNPSIYLNPQYKDVDIEMSALKALNCWTEVYRNNDSSILKRETNRILEVI